MLLIVVMLVINGDKYCYNGVVYTADCCYAECHLQYVILCWVIYILLSVVMMSVIYDMSCYARCHFCC